MNEQKLNTPLNYCFNKLVESADDFFVN